MTFKVAIALTLASLSVAASAAAAGNYRAQLLVDDAVVHTQDSSLPEFAIGGVAEGEYTVSVSRLDVTGVGIGVPYSEPLVVAAIPPEMVNVDVPSGMAVTVTPE